MCPSARAFLLWSPTLDTVYLVTQETMKEALQPSLDFHVLLMRKSRKKEEEREIDVKNKVRIKIEILIVSFISVMFLGYSL